MLGPHAENQRPASVLVNLGTSTVASSIGRLLAPPRSPPLEVEEVHRRRADEVGHENARPAGRRSRAGVRELFDDAIVHHGDLVGHRHGFELVVRDVDRGRLQPVVQRAQFAAHDMAELRVERAERLVHHECHRPAHDGAAESHALSVAAREAGDRAVEQVGDPQDARGLLDALA